jgi:endonuclease/exonuclease/phosphatase (EEP) superfamily protein YafD
MVVLVLNTHGTVSAADIAALVASRGADVVSLPETSATTAEQASELLADQGLDYQVLAEVLSGGGNPSTAALVSTSTGRYRITDSGPAATFVATGTGPPLIVVHTRAPVNTDLSGWAASTRAAVSSCAGHPGGIVAGDFNATLDHPAFASLDGCVDAAAVAGSAGVATWPSAAPRMIGAPIDHVLVDPARWTVLRTTVLDPPPGTDHRVVEAVLVPAGSMVSAG